MKKLTILFALLCASVMGWPIDWNGYDWLGNGGVDTKYNSKIKADVSPSLGTGFINNLQKKGTHDAIHIAMPSADFGAFSLDAGDYTLDGAGFFPHLSAFTKQENTFTVVCSGTTYTFTIYYADGEPDDLTDWNIARGKTVSCGYAALPASNANDGNSESRWGSEGAKHYAAVGENAEDWWYVDLGNFYRVDQVKILFERANPSDYDLLISNNAVTWTVLGTYTTESKFGNNPESDYNVYDFSADPKVGRFVKIFARNGYAGLAYGFSMYEFEVYGDHATIADSNPPSMTSATLAEGTTHNQVNIAVAASDAEGVVTQFHVVDASKSVDQACTATNGVIAVTGLSETTSYSFTITALDAAGNESENSFIVAATTTTDLTIPQTAAPTPSGTNKEIRPIYSDAFSSILEHSFDKDGFAGLPLYMEKNISGDNCLVYDRSGAAQTFVTWGMYDDGANAIIAQSEYRAAGKMGVDASEMENLHIDIWSLQACNTILVRINDAGRTGDLRLSHDGNGWKSYDIPISEFTVDADENKRVNNVRWFKFEAFDAVTGKFAIDNVYFWKAASGLSSVAATPNNSTMGTATVKQNGVAVTEVATGSEVTFSAVANDGYIFVNWSNGETQPTFTTAVNATMNLTANFRALGTVYCMTEMEVDGHIIYVTMKRIATNSYRLIVRSNEELQGFGNAYFYRPNNIQVGNIKEMGVLSDNNHTLTATFSAETVPYMTTPLYVEIRGVGERIFPQLTNIEYDVECDDAVSVSSVSLPATAAVAVGATTSLTATVTPAFATNQAVTWSSDNTAVATVSDQGVVTGVAAGTAHITATSVDGGRTAQCNVTVLESQIYWGNGRDAQRNVSIAYSIEYISDKTLTFTLEAAHDKVGFVVEVTVNGAVEYARATSLGDNRFTYTTEATYEVNEVVTGFFYMSYQNGAARVDFSYTVGSTSENRTYAPVVFDQDATDASWIVANNGQTRDVTVARTLTANTYFKTICFPFSMTAEQIDATFGDCEILLLTDGRMKTDNDIYLQYVPVREIVAGKPYLMTVENTVTGLDFNGVTINSSTDNNEITVTLGGGRQIKMIGTFTKQLINDDDLYYLDIDGFLHSVSAYGEENNGDPVTIPAFRCYYQFAGFGGNMAPVRVRVVKATDVVTGFEDATGETAVTKQLRDGQLFIIRNGKCYTVTGAIVK